MVKTPALFSLLSLTEYFCESQVALVYPNNDPVMFMVAFYGCLLAEVIPVPIEVPLTRKVIVIDRRGVTSYESKLETNKLLVLDALTFLRFQPVAPLLISQACKEVFKWSSISQLFYRQKSQNHGIFLVAHADIV